MKTPKRVKGYVNVYPNTAGHVVWSTATEAKTNSTPRRLRTARLVELRKGEVIVDVEKAAVMAANWAYDFPDRWDSAVRKFHNEVRAALRKVGKR